MLPSILAKQLQKGIGDYIETTFPMTNEPFKGSVEKMLANKALFTMSLMLLCAFRSVWQRKCQLVLKQFILHIFLMCISKKPLSD